MQSVGESEDPFKPPTSGRCRGGRERAHVVQEMLACVIFRERVIVRVCVCVFKRGNRRNSSGGKDVSKLCDKNQMRLFV